MNAYREDPDARPVTARTMELEKQLANARTMVLRLVVAQYRQGWETGESEQEVLNTALDCLSNWGINPHVDRKACRALLQQYNPEVEIGVGAPRLWLDDSILEHAAELLAQPHCPECHETLGGSAAAGTYEVHCPSCNAELDLDYQAACADSVRRLREIAAAAKASKTIGPRGWPVVTIEVQGTGEHMRRKT